MNSKETFTSIADFYERENSRLKVIEEWMQRSVESEIEEFVCGTGRLPNRIVTKYPLGDPSDPVVHCFASAFGQVSVVTDSNSLDIIHLE